MYFIYLFVIFLLLLILMYYYFFIKNIICIKNKIILNIVCVLLSIVLLFLWFYGLTIKSILTPFMIYSTFIVMVFDAIILFVKNKTNKNITKFIYIIPIIISLSICLYGKYNMNNQVLKEYNIKSNKVLNEDIKILFLSDIHYGDLLLKDDLDKMLDNINELNDIDFVLLGGDITDESTSHEEVDYLYKRLSEIKSKHGVFFVYGNHDGGPYRKSYFEYLESILNKYKINTLTDEMYIKDNIAIIGRRDYSYDRRDLSDIIKHDLSDIYTIVLDHQPKDYINASNIGVDLLLSGHTHAGQIFPLGLFIDLFNTSDNSYGHKKINNLNAIVSSGVSGWGIPVRTGSRSEYVIINIKNE